MKPTTCSLKGLCYNFYCIPALAIHHRLQCHSKHHSGDHPSANPHTLPPQLQCCYTLYAQESHLITMQSLHKDLILKEYMIACKAYLSTLTASPGSFLALETGKMLTTSASISLHKQLTLLLLFTVSWLGLSSLSLDAWGLFTRVVAQFFSLSVSVSFWLQKMLPSCVHIVHCSFLLLHLFRTTLASDKPTKAINQGTTSPSSTEIETLDHKLPPLKVSKITHNIGSNIAHSSILPAYPWTEKLIGEITHG